MRCRRDQTSEVGLPPGCTTRELAARGTTEACIE